MNCVIEGGLGNFSCGSGEGMSSSLGSDALLVRYGLDTVGDLPLQV